MASALSRLARASIRFIDIDTATARTAETPTATRWGLLHAFVGVAIFAAGIFLPALIPAELMSPPLALACAFALPAAVIVWIVVVSRRWGTGNLIRDYGLRFRWIDLLGIPVAFGVIWFVQPMVVVVALLIFGDPGGSDTNVVVSPEPLIWVPQLVLAVVLAPFVEEVVFRGMLQPSLRRWFDGEWPDADRRVRATNGAVILTSLVFCSLHLPQIVGGVNGVALGAATFFSGIVFGVHAMATRRTAPSIVVHAAANLVAVVTAYGLMP
ncbi:CPBP family intramembrane glutamic endopeptidase [Agromyces sp. NPDC058136]|uniref:CPBP family intramembrane glutamic endopeptidase n=1 Tax=Agromyces sp. NPDC058136 TaxID=3346354 RepID=UPI0036D8F9B7